MYIHIVIQMVLENMTIMTGPWKDFNIAHTEAWIMKFSVLYYYRSYTLKIVFIAYFLADPWFLLFSVPDI